MYQLEQPRVSACHPSFCSCFWISWFLSGYLYYLVLPYWGPIYQNVHKVVFSEVFALFYLRSARCFFVRYLFIARRSFTRCVFVTQEVVSLCEARSTYFISMRQAMFLMSPGGPSSLYAPGGGPLVVVLRKAIPCVTLFTTLESPMPSRLGFSSSRWFHPLQVYPLSWLSLLAPLLVQVSHSKCLDVVSLSS